MVVGRAINSFFKNYTGGGGDGSVGKAVTTQA